MSKSSHSEIESFNLCERRHWYGYGMGLTGVTTSEAQYRGITGHEGLSAYYGRLKAGDSLELATEAGYEAAQNAGKELETYEKSKMDANVELLLAEYFDHWGDSDQEIEVLATEYKIRVPVGDDKILTIVVDLIKREPGVGIVAVDHKFTYDFFNAESVDLNPQLVKYMAALRMERIPVSRLEYNEIRYRDTKENLANPSKRFLRTPFKPTNHRIKETMREHFIAANRIIAFRDMGDEEWENNVTRVANKMVCQSCSFKDICINDLNGWGRDNLLLHDYKIRESVDVDVVKLGDFNNDAGQTTNNGSMAEHVGTKSTGFGN